MECLQYRRIKISIHFEKIRVLNLVINGMPSILKILKKKWERHKWVLNLVINGMPSILLL